MTKTHILGGEISNFSGGLCERIVIVSVCSRQINCIILVLRLLYHSEEPSPATQRKPVTPRNAFPRSSWITREPHSANALSLPALLRRCSDMIVIFHGKKSLLRGPWMFRCRLRHPRRLHFQGVCFISLKEDVTIYWYATLFGKVCPSSV